MARCLDPKNDFTFYRIFGKHHFLKLKAQPNSVPKQTKYCLGSTEIFVRDRLPKQDFIIFPL
jgi:hypothetical protein